MTRSDYISILGIFIGIAVCFWWIYVPRFSNASSIRAVMTQSEQIIRQVPLNRNSRFQLGSFEIETAPNRIRILHADCPNQACVHMGWIRYPGQLIVCVPNRFVIKLERLDSKPARVKIDAYTY